MHVKISDDEQLSRTVSKIIYKVGKMRTGIITAYRKVSRHFVDSVLHFWYKSRLKNKQFSIICPNCIGGNIYHRLGMEFKTPTINCFTTQDDYIKMIRNLKHYMSCDITFPEELEQSKPYPVGRIDDITYYFNHDTDKEKVKKDWYRRRERIDYDNIYVILYEESPFSREEILSLQSIPCKRLVVLTDKTTHGDLNYVRVIKRNYGKPNEAHFLDRDEYGVQTFEKHFDFVAWINGREKW